MSIADDLPRLHELYRSGGLTEAEFMLAKSKVLGERPGAADPRPARPDDDPALRAALPPYQPTRWPAGARVAVIVLLIIVIAILAAPIAYKAFERSLFSNMEWTFFGN